MIYTYIYQAKEKMMWSADELEELSDIEDHKRNLNMLLKHSNSYSKGMLKYGFYKKKILSYLDRFIEKSLE